MGHKAGVYDARRRSGYTKMRLVLIRHAHTDWNEQGKVQGRIDVPLNKTGHEQAKALSFAFRNRKFDTVYSSPLLRSVETAGYLEKVSGTGIVIENDLTEIQFGEWEGLSFEQIGKTYQKIYEVWRDRPFECAVPKAETLQEVLDRSVNLLKRLYARHKNGIIAVVSHTLPIKLMIAFLIGLPYNRVHSIRLDNTGRTELNVNLDGRSVLAVMNDTSHLSGAKIKWHA
ncbi:MAG: Phosphoserine phosphatase 1 [Firmicutes bacterium ADurb.Bin182]|nr:MAG: Phosphoserine phosphatase 1 [Firmicutes bacterium ADurb.Bin182]